MRLQETKEMMTGEKKCFVNSNPPLPSGVTLQDLCLKEVELEVSIHKKILI